MAKPEGERFDHWIDSYAKRAAKGVPWFLEANVLPGLTETSLLPQAILASGSTLGDVYYSLAQAALRGRG
jgi:D-alanine-D-alanine ligase-like ATP-grasp enzyme